MYTIYYIWIWCVDRNFNIDYYRWKLMLRDNQNQKSKGYRCFKQLLFTVLPHCNFCLNYSWTNIPCRGGGQGGGNPFADFSAGKSFIIRFCFWIDYVTEIKFKLRQLFLNSIPHFLRLCRKENQKNAQKCKQRRRNGKIRAVAAPLLCFQWGSIEVIARPTHSSS